MTKHDPCLTVLHRGAIITVRCGFCGGSGYFAGTYGDIPCIDCETEGSWEVEENDFGTEVIPDPFEGRM